MAKKADLQALIAKRVRAGEKMAVETVDFSDPNRPKTCLEVDFPILPVNQVAIIEGNAGKPIYQMSKWWARRRSSVFRAMLLGAAMKAPDDPTLAAKAIWDAYYGNHQALGALSHLRVADIFAGGGTTLVEGSRLGMQMVGSELNPVAWFVIRNEFSKVTPEEVRALLDDVEAAVKPAIMPYYACECPRGHKGQWIDERTGESKPEGFEPWTIPVEERGFYSYSGPEIIYVFWSKHGPCPATGCGHRTPLMKSPVMAIKTLSVKSWSVTCAHCSGEYDLENGDARMAPGVPLVVADTEAPFAVMERSGHCVCPHCKVRSLVGSLGKGRSKKIELSLLVHPRWLRGCPAADAEGRPYGGSATDSVESTRRWLDARAQELRLLEVRGVLPDRVTCPETGEVIDTGKGPVVPKTANFECGGCGGKREVLDAVKTSGKTGPLAPFGIQAFCPSCAAQRMPYGGRFFVDPGSSERFGAASEEWQSRQDADLAGWWASSEVPFGHLTHQRNPADSHGFTHWSRMFHPRQLLVHSQLLRAISGDRGSHRWDCREFVLGAFQQYLRNQNLFCFWNPQRDSLEPHFSNNNYHPKSILIENSVFATVGRGNWQSSSEGLLDGLAWSHTPWEVLSAQALSGSGKHEPIEIVSKGLKLRTGDPLGPLPELLCHSSSDLAELQSASLDLVITDPPFEGLLHYSELADFFYVWLRLALKDRYPDQFSAEYSPKALEAVANPARHGDQGSVFYRNILTECWREAHRTLKAGGILAFTFHHSQDDPWINVLESLFEAGFYLEAIYPIRSDETKGAGEFGSKTVEYDMIHVCRKRMEEPKPISWARLRRAILQDIQQLKVLLESHAHEGLPEADLQVIRRGKALEHYSRHYGQVYLDDDNIADVRRAILGVNQLLEETVATTQDRPPGAADPLTRRFLQIFASSTDVPRDHMIKSMQGTGISPSEFEAQGWCIEQNKVYRLADPLKFAQNWRGQKKRNLTQDLDQALVLVGACMPDSGIKAEETLKNAGFKAHPGLGPLLEWMMQRSGWPGVPPAAKNARILLRKFEVQKIGYEAGELFAAEPT